VLTVSVHDNGAGAGSASIVGRPGSGIARLRARLDALCPGSTFTGSSGSMGTVVTLTIPQHDD
jgi:hypothetical protein